MRVADGGVSGHATLRRDGANAAQGKTPAGDQPMTEQQAGNDLDGAAWQQFQGTHLDIKDPVVADTVTKKSIELGNRLNSIAASGGNQIPDSVEGVEAALRRAAPPGVLQAFDNALHYRGGGLWSGQSGGAGGSAALDSYRNTMENLLTKATKNSPEKWDRGRYA